ncbi:MAG: hypothetical protein JNM52_05135, partial [Betaproteobacteria bacterium]|nr:hypothetical protein [Betaproteobacteria bacterium]
MDPGLSAALSIQPTRQGFSFRYGSHDIGDSNVIWNYYKTSHAAFGFTPEWVESYVADKQCNAVFASLLLCMADRVVNSLRSMQEAGSKLHQQHMAHQLGLTAPDTLVSNDPEEIRAWCAPRGDVIIKALGSPILPVLTNHPGLGQDVMPTCRVSQELLEQMGNERCVHPYLIQKEVPKAYEIRALMVRDRLFACSIDSQQEASMEIDWR